MRNNKRFTVVLLILGTFGLIPVAASASSLPHSLMITLPGLVTISAGKDQDTLLSFQVSSRRLRNSGYEFGYVDAGTFSFITNGTGGSRNQSFLAGTAVDFALRYKGADDIFGTSDDAFFKISDAASHVTQRYSDPLRGWKPGDTPLFRKLTLAWDTNHDGIDDLVLMLKSRKCDASVHYSAAATPVPVPAAIWLFGSGLAGLTALVHRRKQS